MKKVPLLLFILTFSLIGFSQNYKLFNDGQKAYYKLDNSLYGLSSYICGDCYFGVSVDSFTMMGTDKVIHHENTVRQLEYTDTCWLVADTSWVGTKTIVKPNGDYLFFTGFGDTILVKSQAFLGDEWKMFDFQTGGYVQAIVSDVVNRTLYGTLDSVKVLDFILYDSNGSVIPISSYLEMEISKNYGLLVAPDFLNFAKDTTLVHLVGHDALSTPFKNITYSDIYDFNIGDEFHTLTTFTPSLEYQSFKYIKKIVIAEQITGSQIQYDFDVEMVHVLEDSGNITRTYSTDTIQETYNLYHFSDDLLPHSTFSNNPTNNSADLLNYYRLGYENTIDENMNGRIVKRYINHSISYNRFISCDPSYISDTYTEKEFIEGVGGPYDYSWLWSPSSYILKYFKKGNETWGVPFDISLLANTEKINAVQNIKITPNPSDNFIRLDHNQFDFNEAQVSIYSMNGILVKQISNFNSFNTNTLNVQDLVNGMYILEIRNQESVWIGKFLKK